MYTRTTSGVCSVSLALSLAASLAPGAVEAVPATWINGNGNYSDITKWDVPIIPCNAGSTEFQITIPANIGTVSVDVVTCNVDTLNLDNNSTLSILAGNTYTVLGQADLFGIVRGLGGDFTAMSAALPGTRARASATLGSIVTIGALDYSSAGLLLTANLFSSTNPGSVLDLSSLQTMDAGFVHNGGGTLVHTVTATDSGVIDLSGLTSVTAPASDEDRLDFTVTGPVASIDLSSLATIGGGSQTRFNVNSGGSQSLPALQNVANSRFIVSGASTLTANGPLWDYASTGLLLTANLFSSTNTGSVLDLSSLQTLDAGFVHNGGGTLVHTVTATDSGVIDLSGLTSVTAPASDEDRLDFTVTGPVASIDLSSLATIGGGSQTVFSVTGGGSQSLPALQNVANSRFIVSGASTLTANGPLWDYASTGLLLTANLFSSTNPGSVLDLSSLQTLDAGFVHNGGGTLVHTVTATDSGVIDLSSLTSVIAPASVEDRLDFVVDAGELLVGAMDNVMSGGGQTRMLLKGPMSSLVAPASFEPDTDVMITADADSTIRIGEDYSFAHTDETRIDLESAVAHFNGNAATPQFVEAGGFDIGALTPIGPNFGFGQMIVGTDAQATTVNLRDAVDNGNGHVLCGPGEEALYLLGLPADPMDPAKIVNGLRILGGSTLVLNGIPLYTIQDGVLVDVRTWFGPGQTVLAYALNDSNGFIALGSSPDTDADADGVLDVNDNCALVANGPNAPLPWLNPSIDPNQRDTNADGFGNICDPDLDNNGVVQAADLALFKPLFFTGDADADFDGNGVVQAADLAIMKRMFFGSPGPSCVVP